MNGSCWLRVVVMVVVTLIIPAVAEIARAGDAGGPLLLRISGEATVTGRDIQGTQIPLGSGPFSLDLTVPSPFRTAPDNAGQQTWSSFSSEFWLNAPHTAFPRGGMTIQNTITAAREGEPDADFISFGVFDCAGGDCSIPISSLPNSEALGFEGMFGNVLLPDGALGTGPVSSLGDFVNHIAGLDLSTATDTQFNATYVPESLLGTSGVSGAGAGGGGPDIRFVSIDGTITDIRIVPEHVTLVLLMSSGAPLVSRRRRSSGGRSFL